MTVLDCYRLLLGLYPKEFRRQFSAEMLHVFEQRARGCSLTFIVREFYGLCKGAQIMWIEKIIPIRKSNLEDNTAETALPLAELNRRREEAVSRMVRAIATHDFPAARRYSAEEMRLQALLQTRGSGPTRSAGAA